MARKRAMTVVHDGELTMDEALNALGTAAQAATEALPKAFAACQTDAERQKVQADRDTIVIAFLNCLKKSLVNTSTLFEMTAADLEKTAARVRKDAASLKNATEAINLLTDLVRLAASLALAFALRRLGVIIDCDTQIAGIWPHRNIYEAEVSEPKFSVLD